MQQKETITCAITPGVGCAMPPTATVFRPVVKAEMVQQIACSKGSQTGSTTNTPCMGTCPGCTTSTPCTSTCPGSTTNTPCMGTCPGSTTSTPCMGTCPGNTTSTPCTGTCPGLTACTPCADQNNNANGCNNGAADSTCSCTEGTTTCVTTCTTTCTPAEPAPDPVPDPLPPATGNSPAMVYEAAHTLAKLYNAEEAIRKGTLFAQLYMPMMGESADACGAPLCQGQAEAFAAWELRLYLNTHPCDKQALQLFKQYARKAYQPNYAAAYAFEEGCDDRWNWTDAPWPWEQGCQ